MPLVPVSDQFPLPFLTTEVAPPVPSMIPGSKTLSLLVFVPVSVSVRMPLPLVPNTTPDVNPNDPAPRFSIVEPFTPTTNLRDVVVFAAPV